VPPPWFSRVFAGGERDTVSQSYREPSSKRSKACPFLLLHMGVDIHNLGDRSRWLHASWWQWRPAVELIRSLRLFDEKRLDDLSNGCGQITATEARQLAAALEEQVVSTLRSGQRVLLDGSVTAEPDDGTFYRSPEEQHRNYSADYDWLVAFVTFCKESDGLHIC
jgi:hypothetical protein